MLPNLETRGLLPVQSPVPSFSKYGRLAGTENSVFNFYNLLSKSIKKVVGWLLYFQKVAWFGAMRIECALNQSTSGGGLEPNGTESLFIHRITIKSHTVTPPRTATLSKLSLLGHHTRTIRHLRYKLWWPVMLEWYWLGAAKKRPLTKWSHVVHQSSPWTSSTTSDKVREIIEQNLVCVSIHLEFWLDKAKSRNHYMAAVGGANQ